MVKLKRLKRLSFKSIAQTSKDYLSFVVIGTVVLGYLSFYSYAARYSLSYLNPNITFITGLGIVCLIILILFYFVGKFRSIYRSYRVLILILLLYLINTNPLLLFAILYGLLDQNANALLIVKPNFKILRIRYLSFNKKSARISRIFALVFIVIGIFFRLKIFISYVFIDSCLFQIQSAIFNKPKTVNLAILIILLPIFVFGYFIQSSSSTTFGIAQQSISITKKDSTILRGLLVYKDDNNLYLKDSSYIANYSPINATFSNCIVLKIDEIKSYKTLQVNLDSNYDHGLLGIYKTLP